MMRFSQKLWMGSRPKTWSNAIAPVMVGVGSAWGTGRFVHDYYTIILLMGLSLGLIVTVNFANDYADGINGADAHEYRVGSQRLVGSGHASARFVKTVAVVMTVISALMGALLCWHIHSWGLLVVGVGCVLLAWGYTSGPVPLAYCGLGEVTVFIMFGLVAVLGSEYACCGMVTGAGWAGAVSMGALSASIMVTNNVRDIDSDSRQGKTTLAVKLGHHATRVLYVWLIMVPLIVAIILARENMWMLIALVTVIPLGYACQIVWKARGIGLLLALSLTSMAMLMWAGAYVIAMWVMHDPFYRS